MNPRKIWARLAILNVAALTSQYGLGMTADHSIRRKLATMDEEVAEMARKSSRHLTILSMTPHHREAYERSLHAVSLMRRERMSLTAAAREASTRPETVRHLAGSALRRVGHRWTAKPRDRLERRMLLYDRKGTFTVTVRSSTPASRIGEYHNAVRRFLETGDRSKLRPFEGKFIVDARGRRHRFLTDPDAIRRLARAGTFGFDSIY